MEVGENAGGTPARPGHLRDVNVNEGADAPGGRGSNTTCGTFQLTGGGGLSVFTPFMKVVSSIKSAKKRHPDCQVVRRKGRIYVINKTDPRYKARQG